jgi:hypothetical protein
VVTKENPLEGNGFNLADDRENTPELYQPDFGHSISGLAGAESRIA